MTVEVAAPAPRVENPVAYHRLYRGVPNYRWWRPLVALLVFGGFFLVLSVVLAVVMLGLGVLLGQFRTDTVEHLLDDVNAMLNIDAANPFQLIFGLVSVAVMLPFVPLSLRIAGLRPWGMLSSVAFRLRWRWLAWCLIPGVVVIGAVTVITGWMLPLLFGDTGETAVPLPIDPAPFVLSLVIVILLVPVQATTEEYMYRGLLMQTVGAWVRPVPIAIAASTLLFALSHPQYDAWGMVDVGVFGATAAILAWRTGGLESGIVLHTLNNIVAFVVLASGVTGTTVNSSDGSGPIAIVITLVTMGAYYFWVDRLAAKRGLERRRPLPAPRELPPPVAAELISE